MPPTQAQVRLPDRRRRQTVIRKLRRLCDDYRAKVVIIMIEPSDRRWIYKTHDDVPGLEEALRHPRTRNIYDFEVMKESDCSGCQPRAGSPAERSPQDIPEDTPEPILQSTSRPTVRPRFRARATLMTPPRYVSPRGRVKSSPPLPMYRKM